MLVDDDAELGSLLGEFLQREGFTVDCEHEGYEGLEKTRGAGVDLVGLDVMLRGIDGFEIPRRLRHESRVRVVMPTARGEDEDRIVGLDLGADDYLPKPLNAHFSHIETGGLRQRGENPGTDGCVHAASCRHGVRRGGRAPWDTFVRPQVFADHSGVGGVTP